MREYFHVLSENCENTLFNVNNPLIFIWRVYFGIMSAICVEQQMKNFINQILEERMMIMTFEEMAKKRFSVRKYSTQEVEEEKLQKILEVANLAPTAKNLQSPRIYVIRSEEGLNQIRTLTRSTYNAPIVLLFAYDDKEAFQYPDQETQNSGAEDCSIVATHVMFEALEQGLGTCWVNLFTPAEVKKAFHLPANIQPVLLMDLGYPASDARPASRHTVKKELSDIVSEL